MKKSALILLSIILLIAGCSRQPAPAAKIPITSAHRGAATIAPENTMASVDSCIKYGVGNIECDVCISKDSVFYVLHDSTLDRTTNGTGAISQWLSTDIDTLDAGSWFAPRFAGQRVLRLTDLLRKAKEHGLRITIDYRNGGLHQLLNLIKDEGMLENCNFTFSKEYHAKCFRKMAPEVRTLQAYIKSEKDIEHVVKELHPDIAVVWIDSLTPQFVKKCREHNLQVLALVLGLDDKTEENQKAVDLGVDIIATDHPEKFIMKYGKPSIYGKRPAALRSASDRHRPPLP